MDVEKDSSTYALSGLQAMVDERNGELINLLDDILPTKVPRQPRLKLILPKPVGIGPDLTVIEFARRNTGGKPSTFEALQRAMGIEDKTTKKKVKVQVFKKSLKTKEQKKNLQISLIQDNSLKKIKGKA